MVNISNLYELAQYLESSALREGKTSLVIHAVNQDRNGNVERSEICNANVVGTITIETLANLVREYPLLVARANEAQGNQKRW